MSEIYVCQITSSSTIYRTDLFLTQIIMIID